MTKEEREILKSDNKGELLANSIDLDLQRMETLMEDILTSSNVALAFLRMSPSKPDDVLFENIKQIQRAAQLQKRMLARIDAAADAINMEPDEYQ